MKQQLSPVSVVDEDGSRHASYNGDILSDIFSNSPVYRRETPPEYEILSGSHAGTKVGYYVNGERIVRCFGDYDTALLRLEDIWGSKASSAGTRAGLLKARYKAVPGAVQAAEELFEQVDREIPIETLRQQLEPSVCGGSPRVGAFLANEPLSMNRYVSQLNAQGAIRVFVDLSTSSGTSGEAIYGRGIALLALMRCLQQVRPVELWITTSGTCADSAGKRCHTLFGLRVASAPLDLAVASRALADHRVRDLCYRGEMRLLGVGLDKETALAWSGIPYAAAVGATDQDIVIGPHKEGEKNAISPGTSPVAWVKKEIELWLDKSGNSAALASLA